MNQLQFGIIASIYFIFIFLCIMFLYIYMWKKKSKLDKYIVEAIKNSIKHHKRMQKWVKNQDQYEVPDSRKMEREIKENWFSLYCDLCNNFFCFHQCPLQLKYGACSNSDRNAWTNLYYSFTWKEWLIWDKELVKQLKSLL